MSDYEDEMDIDVPISKDITFAAESSKGKRSAANLPVEAEDSLPWLAIHQSLLFFLPFNAATG